MIYCKSCGADLPPNKEVRDNKQIKIEELIPFMNEGWLAKDMLGGYTWFLLKPRKTNTGWLPSKRNRYNIWLSRIFNIESNDIDWTKSLIKIERK